MNILIVSINAKHFHKSLAPWCLKSFVEAQGQDFNIEIFERDINDSGTELLYEICAAIDNRELKVVAFSCYIWNIEFVKKVAYNLKKIRPKVKIVLGGPEVIAENSLENYPFADLIIKGAGEMSFYNALVDYETNGKFIASVVESNNCHFALFSSPFTREYFKSFELDKLPVDKKLVYYESSRGCPFNCAYCLSSSSKGIFELSLDRVEKELRQLVEFGIKVIKFVDRTANANRARFIKILEFIKLLDTDCVFHFEVAPDLFSDELLDIIKTLPKARVQFELGIQSFNENALRAVNRRQDADYATHNIKQLVKNGNCHIHVGLIAGLPFETLDSFILSINKAMELKAHCVQLGFLKLLKGAELNNVDMGGAIFDDKAPYSVLKTDTMSTDDLLLLYKIDKIIDKFYNKGAFLETINFASSKIFSSSLEFLKNLASYLEQNKLQANMSLKNAYSALYDFLVLSGANIDEIVHYIKFDCFSFDRNGLSLPPQIQKQTVKSNDVEKGKGKAQVATEYFSLTNQIFTFTYDKKCPITNRYSYK